MARQLRIGIRMDPALQEPTAAAAVAPAPDLATSIAAHRSGAPAPTTPAPAPAAVPGYAPSPNADALGESIRQHREKKS